MQQHLVGDKDLMWLEFLPEQLVVEDEDFMEQQYLILDFGLLIGCLMTFTFSMCWVLWRW